MQNKNAPMETKEMITSYNNRIHSGRKKRRSFLALRFASGDAKR